MEDPMLNMISPDRALDVVRANAARLEPFDIPTSAAEGMILAEPVHADRDAPPFPRAMMDGYATRLEDAGKKVQLVGEVAAGQAPAVSVQAGSCVQIMTGASCPEGAEVVVPVEDTTVAEGRVQLPEPLAPGKHIARRGCDCLAGSRVLEQGQPITPLSAAVLAAAGKQRVKIFRPPLMAIIATGSELCRPDEQPADYQIFDSNGPMLMAQARRAGFLPSLTSGAADSMASLSEALRKARRADIVMLTGGVSMGRYDLVPDALKEHGVSLLFHNVPQKPGKPLLFGRKGEQLYFGLPGNPLASHLCFEQYVLPAAQKMAGRPARTPVHSGILTRPLEAKTSRTLFLLANGRFGDGGLKVLPLPGSGSADLYFKQLANGYIRIEPGEHQLETGERVKFQFHGGRQ